MEGELDILPQSLIIFECSNNLITSFKGPIPSKLRTFIANGNAIRDMNNLEFGEKLKFINVSINMLTELPPLKKCRKLRIVLATNNLITKLSNDLPNTLQELDLNRNKLTQLPSKLPRELHYLDIDNNLIRSIDLSITNCSQLLVFFFARNPVFYAGPDVRKFLNTRHFSNMNSLTTYQRSTGAAIFPQIDELPPATLYEDPESVHRTVIQQTIHSSVENIISRVSDYCLDDRESLEELMSDPILTSSTKNIILAEINIHGDKSIANFPGLTVGSLFKRIWFIIRSHNLSADIKAILNSDFHEFVCDSGFIGRMVNCLSSFVDYINVGISLSEQYGNIVMNMKMKLGDNYSVEEHQRLVRREFEERGVDQETADIWIHAIL